MRSFQNVSPGMLRHLTHKFIAIRRSSGLPGVWKATMTRQNENNEKEQGGNVPAHS